MMCKVAATLAACCAAQAAAKSFMGAQRSSLRNGASEFISDVDEAMGHALGCGGRVEEEALTAIERSLLPMWKALPKNGQGRIEKRMLRYLTHRHFMRKSSMVVRGFEMTPPVNASDWASAEILSQRVPGFVESVLQSRHKDQQGFHLRDAAYMIATLEQLIFESEAHLLEEVYMKQRKPLKGKFTRQGLEQVLEEYVMRWLVGDNPDGMAMLTSNRAQVADVIPHWSELVAFYKGEIKSYDLERQFTPKASGLSGTNAMSLRYSFEDAHQVAGRITSNFGSYWQSECNAMREALVEMDRHGTGRVPLATFYSGTLGGEWRFGESESYLRVLGVLDETSAWHGKQVIIPNYIQAASNCVVSGPHYLVCCANDCGAIFDEIEAQVARPVASVEEILGVVGNTTAQTTVEHDEAAKVTGSLRAQLEDIAAANGGAVPLHGRLFAQWLHYVFPRECPFPHKAGSVTMLTPADFKEEYLASVSDLKARASEAVDIPAGLDKEEVQWMSQWSAEEELIADYTDHLRSPWECYWQATFGAVMLAVMALTGMFGLPGKGSSATGGLPLHGKTHFV